MKKILEDNEYLTMPQGSTVYTTSRGDIEGLIFSGGGHSIHAYAGKFSEGHDVEVCVYDNIKLKITRGRKQNPEIVIEHDEWPCTVKVHDNSKNMKVIVCGEQSK